MVFVEYQSGRSDQEAASSGSWLMSLLFVFGFPVIVRTKEGNGGTGEEVTE